MTTHQIAVVEIGNPSKVSTFAVEPDLTYATGPITSLYARWNRDRYTINHRFGIGKAGNIVSSIVCQYGDFATLAERCRNIGADIRFIFVVGSLPPS